VQISESFKKQKKFTDLIELYDGLYQEDFAKLLEQTNYANSVNGADKTT